MMPDKLTTEQAAIVSAFTGTLAGKFSDLHEYAERLLERPILTHEFGRSDVSKEIAEKSRADFIAICAVEADQ